MVLKRQSEAPDLSDVEQRISDSPGPRALRTRAIGAMMLAGGALAGITAVLPPSAGGSEALVLAVGAVATLIGAAMLLGRRELPEWVLGLAAALGTVLITLATYEGGASHTGTADNEMLYVWVCLFSFYFFRLPGALLELAFVGVAYGWLLSTQGIGTDEAVTRMAVTLGTLLVAGLLVARLRDSLNRLVLELTDRARHDSLTRLYNRGGLEEHAAAELAADRSENRRVAMLVADLDDFKLLNDTLGHPAGDQILRRVAKVLQQGTREGDAVARLGGDEFGVLLANVSAADAHSIAERLRVAVRRSASAAHLRLTLSVGVAFGPEDGTSLEQLWKAADRAMYVAKRSGGDAVALASGLPEPDSPGRRGTDIPKLEGLEPAL